MIADRLCQSKPIADAASVLCRDEDCSRRVTAVLG
jgi:hypothetical protein